jgi:hypothetical protein
MAISPVDVETVVQQIKSSPDDMTGVETANSILSYLSFANRANDFVPRWWSPSRDAKLRELLSMTGAGMLNVALYTSTSKLLSIPYTIEPRDSSNASHARQAREIEMRIKTLSQYGSGLESVFHKFITDLLTQDNGGFMEIVSEGPKSTPASGSPIGLVHLDAQFVTRTGDPIYPIKYTSKSGDKIKYHFSRVIFASQMTSPMRDMHGVGRCALSRALDFTRTLIDLTLYRQERFGSRPASRLLVGKGIAAKDIAAAFRSAEVQEDADGQRRAGRNIAIGSSRTDIDIDSIQLTTANEFEEKTTTELALAGIALAFGLDAQELSSGSNGISQAEATISQARVRGRLPKQFVELIEREFNFKVLPPHLKMEFQFIDEDVEQREAVISDIRARRRERNLAGKVTTPEIELQIMRDEGDIDDIVFGLARLQNGKLPNGAPVESLFYSKDNSYTGPGGLLQVDDVEYLLVPGDKQHGDVKPILDALRARCYALSASSGAHAVQWRVNAALTAIDYVEKLYIGTAPGDDDENPADATVGRYHPRTARLRGATVEK